MLSHDSSTQSPVTFGWEDPTFVVRESTEDGFRVLHATGELDLAVRNQFFRACVGGDGVDVVVDLAEVTFMDCAGYGGLVAARLVLQARGGTLTLRNYAGQPMILLSLVEFTDQRMDPTPSLSADIRELRVDVVDPF